MYTAQPICPACNGFGTYRSRRLCYFCMGSKNRLLTVSQLNAWSALALQEAKALKSNIETAQDQEERERLQNRLTLLESLIDWNYRRYVYKRVFKISIGKDPRFKQINQQVLRAQGAVDRVLAAVQGRA